MARLELQRATGELLYAAAQWNGMADDLCMIAAIGFELQPEEGSRTGNKSLTVHDPNRVGYNPIEIYRGEWAVCDIVHGGELSVLDGKGIMDLIASLPEDALVVKCR